MERAQIQIRYGDRFGDTAGCTAVSLPAWLEEAPLPKIRGFLKLAARHGAEYENHGEIIRLEAYITKAITEAERELEKASTTKVVKDTAEARAAREKKRRIENWLKRLRQIQESLTAALDKYYPTRK